jgi:nucleotide-binding universal stress UspA family protein
MRGDSRAGAETPQVDPKRPNLRDILVPVDFSPGAQQALSYAIPLARQFNGRITLLHVVEPQLVPRELSFMAMESNRRVAAARAKLEALASKSVPAPLLKKTVVSAGQPFEEIARIANGLRMDVIVIATQGRTGVKRLLLGSTAEAVVRHSPCPVLTVRVNSGGTPRRSRSASLAPRINRILVPVAFSEPATNPAPFAATLARTMRARLAFLHVIRPLPAPMRVDAEKYYSEALAEARQRLEKIAATVPKGIKTEILLSRHVPVDGITHTAREWRADLILLPTIGRTGLEYIALGSTAEGVVRHAPCAVLTIGRS